MLQLVKVGCGLKRRGVELIAIDLVSLDGLYTYPLGSHDSVTWNDGSTFGGDPIVSYGNNMKSVRVMLECIGSEQPHFEALGETSLNVYTFRLRHRCACWDGCRCKSSCNRSQFNYDYSSPRSTNIYYRRTIYIC